MKTDKHSDNDIQSFMQANPEFNIKRFNFLNKKALQSLNWLHSLQESEKADLLRHLQALQRLSFLTENESAMAALYEKGLHSACQIASLPCRRFIAEYSDCFKDGSHSDAKTAQSAARKVYKKALARRSRTLQSYMSIRQQTQPYYRTSMMDTSSELTAESYGNLPNYESLFGTENYCTCEDCRSIYSPAAYFVDLMRTEANYIEVQPEAADIYGLETRRPDLWNIVLDCANTNDELSKLIIVNQVLEQQYQSLLAIDVGPGDKVAENLIVQNYPFNMPFDFPLSQINQYLLQNKTPLTQIWLALNTAANPVGANLALAGLNLSAVQWNLYSTSVQDPTALSAYYGFGQGDASSQLQRLTQTEIFLARTGLNYVELNELLNEDLSTDEVTQGLNGRFFINAGAAMPISVAGDELANLIPVCDGQPDYERLDNLHRFVRLAKIIGWSFIDLDWALQSVAAANKAAVAIDEKALSGLAWIQNLILKKHLSVNQCCALFYAIKDIGSVSGATFFDSIYNNSNVPNPPQWCSNGEYKLVWYIMQNNPETQALDQQIQNALTAALKISHSDLLLIAYQMNCDPVNVPLPLTLDNLSIFYRLTILSAITGLSIEECFIAWGLLFSEKNEQSGLVTDKIREGNSNINLLLEFVEWLRTAKLSLAKLQYILTGNSYDVALQNQIVSESVCANFIAGLQNAMLAALCTLEAFNQTVYAVVQQQASSIPFADSLYALLVEGNYIQDEVLERIPTKDEMIGLLLQLLPEETSAQNDNLAALSATVVKLLKNYKNSDNGLYEKVRNGGNSDGVTLTQGDFELLTNGVFSFYRVLATQCLDDQGVVLTTDIKHHVNFLIKKYFEAFKGFEQTISDAVGYYATLQQKTLAQYLGSLYHIDQQFVPALALWGGLSFGRLTQTEIEDDMVSAVYHAGVVLLRILMQTQSRPDNFYNQMQCLQYLQRYACLVTALSLRPSEVSSFIGHPQYYAFCYQAGTIAMPVFQFDHDDIRTMCHFKTLVQVFQDNQNRWLAYFDWMQVNDADPVDAVPQLAAITNWDSTDLTFLAQQNWPLNSPDWATVAGIWQLYQWFKLGNLLSLNQQGLWQLNQLYFSDFSSADEAAYDNNQAVADALWGGLIKAYSAQPDLLSMVQNKVNEIKRDALVPIVIYQLDNQYYPALVIGNTRNLYEYLLIDVDVSGTVQTSYISEAISAVQLYINRCINNLEPNTTIDRQLLEWWSWMQNYRLWEANREIFLYPENYITPSLRPNVTPLFSELETRLQQGNLTNPTTVESAFQHYMDGFASVANLALVGSAGYDQILDESNSTKRLCLVGRTATQPYSYYSSLSILKQAASPNVSRYIPVSWQPWESIDLQMSPIGPVVPVFAFGKWFIFWVEQQQSNSSVSMSSGSSQSASQFQALVRYSYLNFQNTWVTPQTLAEPYDLPIDINKMDAAQQGYYHCVYPIFFRSSQSLIIPYGVSEMFPGYDYRLYNLTEGTLNQGWAVAYRYVLSSPPPQANDVIGYFGTDETIALKYCYIDPFDNAELLKVPPVTGADLNNFVICDYQGKLYVAWISPFSYNLCYGYYLPEENTVYPIAIEIRDENQNIIVIYNKPALAVYNDKLYVAWTNNTATSSTSKGLYYGYLDPNAANEDDKKKMYSATALNQLTFENVGASLTVFEDKLYIASTDVNQHPFCGYLNGSSIVSNITLNDVISNFAPSIVAYDACLYIAWADVWVNDLNYLHYGPLNTTGGTNSINDFVKTSQHILYSPVLAVDNSNNMLFIGWIGTNDDEQFNFGWINTKNTAAGIINITKVGEDEKLLLFPTMASLGDELFLGWTSRSGQSFLDHHKVTDRFAFSVWMKIDVVGQPQPMLAGQINVSMNEGGDTLTINVKETTIDVTVIPGQWIHLIVNYNPVSCCCDLYCNGVEQLTGVAITLPYSDPNTGALTLGIDELGNQFQGVMQELLFYRRSLTATEIAALYNNGLYQNLGQMTQYIEQNVPAQQAFNINVNQIPIVGQPNWYIAEGNGAEFLVLPYLVSADTYLDCWRLNSTAFYSLSQRLFIDGISDMLSVPAQQTAEIPFEDLQPNPTYIPPSSYPVDVIDFNNGLMRQYYWEIFFHAPFLIADSLQINLQYAQSKMWYEYIFNPTVIDTADITNDKYWQFIGLRSSNNPTLQGELSETWAEETQQDLTSSAELYVYHNDPFDPFAIATLRPIAYQKTIVMHYVDNLIKWGDSLFAQYTTESIAEATLLYVLAYDLLGTQPVNEGLCPLPEPLSLNELLEESGESLSSLDEFLIALEPMASETSLEPDTDNPNNYIANDYFGLPENEQLLSYWKTVEQRLYDIRHSLNIEGQAQQPALFAPPLDPNQLVQQAVAADQVGQPLAPLQTMPPYYRFEMMVAKAKEMTATVVQLGQSLLAGFEKQDAENLALIYSANRQNILALDQVAKQEQIDAAALTVQALQAGLQSAQDRYNYYSNLITNGLSSKEQAQINLDISAVSFQSAAQPIKTVAMISYLLPTIYGLADGGFDPGSAILQGASISEGTAQLLSMSAGLVAAQASFERRSQDWSIQQILAQDDLSQANCQVAVAQYQLSVAQQELNTQVADLTQEQNVTQFLKTKFTSDQLYIWLTGKLSAIYFQAYQLAYDYAMQAQQAWQFEKGTSQTFIQPGYWDSLHQGLVAGEGLNLDIQRMESAYLKQNQRRFEIEKIISLAQFHGGGAFEDLINTGECSFNLSESDFACDYPSHYCRQIKAIMVSFPAVLGPYQNICATLTQTANTVLISEDINTVTFYLNGEGTPNAAAVRKDMRANQQVAFSQGLNDSGMFELNFNDPRYLPFEGTGVISSWTLSIPGVNNPNVLANLTDVIIRILYTAVPGSATYQQAVCKALN